MSSLQNHERINFQLFKFVVIYDGCLRKQTDCACFLKSRTLTSSLLAPTRRSGRRRKENQLTSKVSPEDYFHSPLPLKKAFRYFIMKFKLAFLLVSIPHCQTRLGIGRVAYVRRSPAQRDFSWHQIWSSSPPPDTLQHTACMLSCFSHIQVIVTAWTVAHQGPLCLWDSPSKNVGVGCHALLQGIFLSQGSNLCLLHCRWILLLLSHQGSPSSTLQNYIFFITLPEIILFT